jgi:hypothetical protein
MHSPAVALAWEFWGRHRLGLSAVAVLVLGFAVASAISPLPDVAATLYSLWIVLALCYVIGVFAYGFEGRLETAESGFPVRLFLLPVRTWVLVGWPMLQGTVVAVLLWLAWDRFVLRPSGIETPAWWPVMLAAVVTVSQAILWLPFGLPWLRLLVAVVVLIGLIRAPAFLELAGDRFTEPETQSRILTAFGAMLLPLAFLLAWRGASRARRGDTSDWLGAWRSVSSLARSARATEPFTSAMAAQVWYEWRIRGFRFVLTVAFMLLALVALGALLERDSDRQTGFGIILLLSPMLLAPFWASYGGTAGVTERSARLSAFAATRPLSNSVFVTAKIRAAGLAALTACVVALVVYAGWLLYTGGYRSVGLVWDVAVARCGTAKAVAFCVLLVAGPVLITWRALVVGLWAGLTGRQYIVIAHTIVIGFFGLQFMYELTFWNTDLARRARMIEVLPWVAAGAVAVKLLVAGWALAILRRRGELETGPLVTIVGVWVMAVASVFALAVWLFPSDWVPQYGLAIGAVLFVPLARLVAAPIALAWNRHR